MIDPTSFIRDGFVAVRGAFEAETAQACRVLIWESLLARGVHRQDSETWRPCVQIPCPSGEPFATTAKSPVLTAAYDDLIGAGRWTRRDWVGGDVAVRFPSEQFPDPGCGYHIEGSYPGPGGFWVNVHSRARGLLALFLFTDVGPEDAPTRLIAGSHRFIPPILQPFGDAGVNADEVAGKWQPSVLCRPAVHATGAAGDVYLCHPFLIHTATWPHRGTTARMVAQPAVHVPNGFALDSSDPSPVAQAIRCGLATPDHVAKA